MKKIVVIILIAALVISAVALLNKRKQEVADVPTPHPLTIQVKVVSATNERLEQKQSFLAKLSSTEVAAISSKLSGRIIEVLVQENQAVKKSDLLIQIDDRQYVALMDAQLTMLKAQEKDLVYTQALHETNRSLFKSGGLAKEKYDASAVATATKMADYEATQQKIVELEVDLSYLNIKAPFDGIVGTIVLRKGNFASPGESLLSINSLGQKLTFSYVPGKNNIKIGQQVFVGGKKMGEIFNLYNDADKGLSVAEVRPDDSLSLPNNSYVTINVLTFAQTGCQIPINGLIVTDKGAKIMAYENEKFSPSVVTIIADNQTHALIEPCPEVSIAVGAAAKLSTLPARGNVLLNRGDK